MELLRRRSPENGDGIRRLESATTKLDDLDDDTVTLLAACSLKLDVRVAVGYFDEELMPFVPVCRLRRSETSSTAPQGTTRTCQTFNLIERLE